MPSRYAESRTSEDVALAASLVAPLARAPQRAAVRDLDGEPIGSDESVVAIAGLAAGYAASGDRNRGAAELVAADQFQQPHPTYYGAAWNALGRLLLTDRTLGGCPPLPQWSDKQPVPRHLVATGGRGPRYRGPRQVVLSCCVVLG